MGSLNLVLPLLMIYYIVKKSDKKYERKIGWMKKIAADFAIVDKVSSWHTLGKHSLEISKFIRGKYEEVPGNRAVDAKTRERAIKNALTHTGTSRTMGRHTFIKASKTLKNGIYSYS
ncbi:hypothetical protein [Thermococcus sp.]